jgi:hypothetical protein
LLKWLFVGLAAVLFAGDKGQADFKRRSDSPRETEKIAKSIRVSVGGCCKRKWDTRALYASQDRNREKESPGARETVRGEGAGGFWRGGALFNSNKKILVNGRDASKPLR